MYNFIRFPCQCSSPSLFYFRKTFFSETNPKICRIKISAQSRYKLYVNGNLVEIGPCKGDKTIHYYDTVDIARFIRKGINAICVEVLYYPDNRSYNFSIISSDEPMLFVEEIEEIYEISAEDNWKCFAEKDFRIISENPYFAPLHILEDRCGDEMLKGWKLPDYDDSGWECAAAAKPIKLSERPVPFMNKIPRRFKRLYGEYKSSSSKDEWTEMLCGSGMVTIPPNSREIVEADAGELMTGFISLRMAGGAGAKIKLLTSECYVLKMPGNGYYERSAKGCRTDCENGKLNGYTDTYHVCGCGEEYAPFWFRTFRFVRLEITTADVPLDIYGFDYTETGYPLEVRTNVRTSDKTLEGVWDISLRTLKRCMQETYTDCPFYEQLQYAMDARSQILYTYSVSGDDRLARQCMEDFRRSQHEDGLLNSCYPCAVRHTIPTFSIYYILMLYDYMMYFGDNSFLGKHMDCVDRILAYFDNSLDGRGLVGKIGDINSGGNWSFIDWTREWNKTTGMPSAGLKGSITMESLLYIMGLERAADISEYLDNSDKCEDYRKRAEAVRTAVNTYCRDEEGIYTDGPAVREYSQHCQVFAVLTDTVSEAEGKLLIEKSLDDEKFAKCSVAMAFYMFRALEKTGLYARTNELWDMWRNMVKNRLTTCVEDNVSERSDCHAWGSLILYELPSVTLGVCPAAPAYAKASISPVAGYMDFAEGNVVTPLGEIHVKWEKRPDGQLDVCYTAPPEIVIEVKK